MHALTLLLRGTTALVLVIASVETLGPLLDERAPERRACHARQSTDVDEAGPRGVHRSLAGELLVASDAMPDAVFRGARIYLIHHDGDGAIGIVVNRPLTEADHVGATPLDDALHDGGPVGREALFVVHSADVLSPSSRMLEADVALTRDPAFLDEVRAGRGPRELVLAIGYAGWGPAQLEREIAEGAWTVEPVDADALFALARSSR